MNFRQLFDGVSGAYSYILASRRGGEAFVFVPALENADRCLRLMEGPDPHG